MTFNKKEATFMAKVTALEMAGNMFVFDNPCCDCRVETTYTEDGKKEHTFRIKRIDGSYKYAYAPIYGLVMIDRKTGSTIYTKVIEDFLNIKEENVDSITDFIEKHGFFIPLPNDNKYKKYNHVDICSAIHRFRCLVELMSLLEDKEIKYKKIFDFITPLLFEKAIVFDNGILNYTSIYTFTDLWERAFELPERKSEFNEENMYSDETYYSIIDSFTGKTENIESIFFDKFIEVTNNSDDSEYYTAKIYKLYRDGFTKHTDNTSRYFIDLLYHDIDDVIINIDSVHSANMSFDSYDDYKTKLIEISKLVIKQELDFHLKGIHPIYDISTMSPNWEITDFYTALYFAIFYTRPNFEVYRRCANPDCNCLFKVSTTNRHKKFHDDSCQTACSRRKNRK